MTLSTITCAFAAMCGLDGHCLDNGPLDIIVVMEEDVPVAELALDEGSPYPVAVTRPTVGIGGESVLFHGGGGLFPAILLSYRIFDGTATVSVHTLPGVGGGVFSGVGTCQQSEGRGL